ncbi:MAG: non-homologous end-joining DNA ligase [Candidatus Methanomethyliaceae archaeon]|nr:non-homologous end-joining DNA ligase [Candidatus Methanomethyliaceae archaeon]
MPERLTKVEFTNLDKILFPELGVTKSQVIDYYIKIAPKMLSILANRGISLKRFPDGIDKNGFYEKDAPLGTPSWVKTFRRYSKTSQRDVNYIVCNNLDTLLWTANLAAVEIHMPLSRTDSYENPDLVLFDIDPEPPATIDNAVETALLLKEKLNDLGLLSYIKTSGKKGLHVVIPVIEGYSFAQTREFAHQIGKQLTKESETIVSELPRSRDPGTVFIDYLQNSHGRTMICPYSLRGQPRATVSTPLRWIEVKKGLRPEEFNIYNVPKIHESPWERLLEKRQNLGLR